MEQVYRFRARLLVWASVSLVGLGLAFQASAQSCDCDHVMYPSLSPAFWGTSTKTRALPGQTICIMAGTYKFMRFYNVQGTAQQPITIKNCGGKVVVDSDTLPSGNLSGVSFNNCAHVVFTGTGAPDLPYGIHVAKTAAGAGVSVGSLSTNFELDHLEVSGSGFSGIMAKTDPGCDSTSWRDNFTMYDVSIHDNFIHDLVGEGIYAGNSFWGTGMQRTCNGHTKVVFPHRIFGLKIYNNRFERTGSEGIQVGCAPDADVHDNVIISAGVAPFDIWQNNGLQIGGGTGGRFYRNTIVGTVGVAMTIIGYLGDLTIDNNLVIGSGQGHDALFLDDRPGSIPNTYVRIMNNTIVNAGRDAIKMYSEIHDHYIVNNALINPASGRYIGTLGPNVRYVARNNFQGSAATAQFIDPLNYDFQVSGTSPLRDAGLSLDSLGLTHDRDGLARPQSGNYDIGAYEYLAGVLHQHPTPAATYSVTAVGNQVAPRESGPVRVSIFPNPGRNEVTCRVSSGLIQEVDVTSVHARSVLHRKFPVAHSSARLHISHLAPGMYVLRVRTESGWHMTRLVRR